MMKFLSKNSLYLAWAVAFASLFGSLYFQYVLNFPPCVLCWYQRIAMYPLVIVLAAGIMSKDSGFFYSAVPLTIVGLLLGIYHNLLYYNIIPESAAPCTIGVSCTDKQVEYFGFVSIPLLSLVAFMIILTSLIIYWRTSHAQRS